MAGDSFTPDQAFPWMAGDMIDRLAVRMSCYMACARSRPMLVEGMAEQAATLELE